MDTNHAVGSSSIQLMIRVGAERGLVAEQLLERTGIAPHVLMDPLAEITVGQEYAVMRNLLRHCGSEPGLGVRAGTHYHVALHGVFGLLLVTGRTLRESLEVALPLTDLGWAFTVIALSEIDGSAVLSIDGSNVPADVRPFLVERITGAVRVIHRELLGADLPVAAVHYRHPAPSDTAPYVEVFGIEPMFGADDNSVRFPIEQLDRPLPQGNEWARRGYEAVCRELLTSRRARTGVAGAVRNLLVERPGEIPDAQAVADRLALSRRTLDRRLEQEGTSFRSLVDEVRDTLAQELLGRAGMTTEQVSRRLGYSDPASFVRAFKRWRGQTPQQFRVRAHA